MVTGGGTGSRRMVTGGGTGSTVFVTGGGTGAQAIAITLPDGTGMAMEVSMGCGSAKVSIVDSFSVPIVTFNSVKVICGADFCGGGFGGGFSLNPGGDFRLER
jgi:hypothetical protein